ncbi:MAG: DUF655 domain-containing protein [Planctomycetales bacterium]|nr:DUF655 domain-containing protein [Planctomycetales bacterium]
MLAWATPTRREALAVALAALALAAVVAARVVRLREPAPPLGPGIRLDLNRAPWWELDLLPGIGERRARAIVADREARGPFRDVEDLESRVPGITPGIVRELRPLVSVGSQAPPASGR